MGDLLGVLLTVVLLAANAFFVAAEFALISARRDRLEALAEQGKNTAVAVIRAGENLPLNLTARPTHFAPKAKSMISLFMHGGPSHVDLLDPKPELTRNHGKEYSGQVVYSFVNRASKKLFGRTITNDLLPVRLLGVAASRLTDNTAIQGDLFDEVSQQQSAVDQAVDAIRERFGRSAIQRGCRVEKRQAEMRSDIEG